ncbi:ankyrin repeat domain-containing protein 33B [Brachyhypopomus gauderio]|uniref:ankyrin repeat domain-containing protein 33B n=1 Tax=Brachyhypopomus gauderio TaxID=698409 RepID=UPI0040417C4D
MEYCSRNREEKKDLGIKDNDDVDDDSDDDDSDDDDVYQVFEEFDFSQLPDVSSIVSDGLLCSATGSLLHHYRQTPESPETLTFFKACCNNNAVIVKFMIRQGITEEEVREVDKNNRTGLMVACYHGYMDVVIALATCPYVDVNWQDSEGNTALMMAAQAGHTMITSYLLNYFAGLDMERRNCHGFTALMKAAMQGQAACVGAIIMSGGDIESRDCRRRLTAREWALLTGHYETARLMQRFMACPYAERFCLSFCMEWPALHEQAGNTTDLASCWRGLLATVCAPFALSLGEKPRESGVLDYMVCMTTVLASPLMADACRPVCLDSPPSVGRLHPALPDILHKQGLASHPSRRSVFSDLTRSSPLPDAGWVAAAALCRSGLRSRVLHSRSSVHPATPPPFLRTGHPATPPPFPLTGYPATPPPFSRTGYPATPPPFSRTGYPATPPPFPLTGYPATPPPFPLTGYPATPPPFPRTGYPATPPPFSRTGYPATPPPRLHLCQSAQTTFTPEVGECRGYTDSHYLQVPSLKHDPLREGRL